MKIVLGWLLLMCSARIALAQQLGQQACPTTQSTIVAYGNGIRRTSPQAVTDLEYLQEKLTPLFATNGINPTDVVFCPIYDSTYLAVQASELSPVANAIDTLLQGFQALLQLGLQTPEQFLYWLSNASAAPPQFNQIEQELNVALDAAISLKPSASGSLEPDILNQLQIYQTALQNHQRIVVVAHSQGNLYVNQAYDLLFPSPSSPGTDQFKVIAVATPADRVAGGGPHTTLLRDPIYLTGDAAGALLAPFGIPVPSSLPFDADNGPCIVAPSLEAGCYAWSGSPSLLDWTFHSFTDSYLGGNGSDPCPAGSESQAPPDVSLSCPIILNETISAILSTLQPTWTQKFPASSPPPRIGHGMAYDAAHGLTVMFGGFRGTGGGPGNLLGDTWVWDGTIWTQKVVNGPPAGGYYSMAYDTAHAQVVLFTGSIGNPNQTWLWDGTTWIRAIPISSPPGGGSPVMAYDSVHGKVVLFGPGDQTWLWDGTNWTQAFPATSPSYRVLHTMAFDAARGKVVLFGGLCTTPPCTSQVLADTWIWDGTNWTQAPASGPPARYGASMVYDTSRQQVVLFGGEAPTTLLNDTWLWDGTKWTQESPATSPPPRVDHAMIYDSSHGQVVVFGGEGYTPSACCQFLNDTWTR